MVFELDATGLGGAEIVVFEELYDEDTLLVSHSDYADESQTIYVEVPTPEPTPEPDPVTTPDTGAMTTDQSNSSPVSGGFIIFVSFGCISVYIGIRYIARKSFLGRHRKF